MTKGLKYISLEWSPDVWNRNGLELEGLGFNLCVAPPHVVVSLILGEKGQVGGLEIGVGDDLVLCNEMGAKSVLRCWMFTEDLASAYVLRHQTPTVLKFRERVRRFG